MVYDGGMTSTEMINRRTRQGHTAKDSAELLSQLIASHSGDNLAVALAYQGFATERQALRFVGAI